MFSFKIFLEHSHAFKSAGILVFTVGTNGMPISLRVLPSPTIGLSFCSLVIFCIVLLVVTTLERLVPGSEAAEY